MLDRQEGQLTNTRLPSQGKQAGSTSKNAQHRSKIIYTSVEHPSIREALSQAVVSRVMGRSQA